MEFNCDVVEHESGQPEQVAYSFDSCPKVVRQLCQLANQRNFDC